EGRGGGAGGLRRVAVDLAGGLGALDPAAIAEVRAQAWPDVRDPDELHDTLLSVGLMPEAEMVAAGWAEHAGDLLATGRASWTETAVGRALAATERGHLLTNEEEGLGAIVSGWLECVGPTTGAALAARLGLAPSRIEIGLAALEATGIALRGRFTPGTTDEEWCDRRLLSRIHRLTLGRLR